MNSLHREFTWSQGSAWDAADPAIELAGLDPGLMGKLLDHITARVAVIGRDHCYVYANREALAFYGKTAAQVVGRHLSEVIGQASYEGYLPWAERLFGGESLRWRGWIDYPVHGRRYLDETMVPFFPEGAAPGDGAQAIVVYGRDHTDLKISEESLAEKLRLLQTSEALKSSIVDYALAAFISTDAAGRLVEFNPAAEAMYGYRRADVIGMTVSELIMPERFRAAHQAGLDRMRSGEPGRLLGKRIEVHALRADGSEFPMEMVLWRTDVAQTVYYTASMVDLSQQKLAEQQIERQREALRQSEKLSAMGTLLAGVAHELNNPLVIVMGRASLLEEKVEQAALNNGGALDPELKDIQDDLRRIREAAERCGRIVRSFLNMARNRPAKRGNVALNTLVAAATDLLRYGFRSHGIELRTTLADAIPDLWADEDLLGQVVLNLLLNAQQALATMPEPRLLRLVTGLESHCDFDGPRIYLRVIDNGPGVEEVHRQRIFEPFFTTKPDGMGTGLGLATSRALAREHGGDLVLESRPGEPGCSFCLSLPISGMSQAATPVAGMPEAPTAARWRVLVVDDEPDLTDLVREMLEAAGHEVAIAESGELALALLDAGRFDAIVSDLWMPGMDGIALWREVSTRHPALARRMLFLTGDTLSPDARSFVAETGAARLDKPFSKQDLLGGIAALLP